MHKTTLPFTGGTTCRRLHCRRLHSLHPSSAPHRSDVARLLRRSRPWRCLGMAILAVATGWGLLALLLPSLTSDSITAVLGAHFPATDTPPLLFWMNLCLSRLPFWFLIAIAGFTRFSGGLTSAVTVYRGLCDGAVLGLLAARRANGFFMPDTVATGRLLPAFAVWAVTDVVIRLVMTLGARRIAGMEWSPSDGNGRMAPSVKKALKRYLLLCLATLCATAATCGVYTAFFYI